MTAALRVGVAGVHGHGRSHVDAVLALAANDSDGAVTLAAVADPRGPGAVPPGVSVFADARDMIDDAGLDIVVLSTPIHTHLPLAEQALARGAHVLLEKPPVTSVADHHRLVEASLAAERAVQVGFQSLGSEGIEGVRDAAASGTVGDIVHVGAVGLWSRSEQYWTRARWSGKRTLDGAVVADGVATNPLAHALASALAIAGAATPEQVDAVRLDMWRANEIDTDDTSSLVVELASGTRIAAGLAVTAPKRHEPYVLVRGTRGHLVYHYTLDVLSIFRDGHVLPQTFAFTRHGLLADLAAHARRGTPLRVPLRHTGAFTRVLEQIVGSAAPRHVPPARVVRVQRGDEAFRVVRGVEDRAERVAWEGRTFTELGGL